MKGMEWLAFSVGVMISVYGFIAMRKCKRTFSSGLTILDDKIKELDDLLQQSEAMVHELNNLSDYVADKVESENAKLLHTFSCIDEKTQTAAKKVEEIEVQVELHNELILKASELYTHLKAYDEIFLQSQSNTSTDTAKSHTPKITNHKHIEAIKMAKQGIDVREIAKTLDVGQGEVKLLLGINKVGSSHSG